MIAYHSCPICSSSICLWRVKRTSSANYRIDQCQQCGYAFVNPRPSLAYLMNYYSLSGHGEQHVNKSIEMVLEEEEQFPNSTIDAKRIVRTIESIKPVNVSKTLLDIGCGYGFFSREAVRTGYDVTALELASNERQIAIELASIDPIPVSFEDFPHDSKRFSVILMSQILEHANDVNLWISKADSLLINGGVLVIALPNFQSIFRKLLQENEPYINPPAHLNFFSRRSLTALLEKHGFTVEATQWVSRIPPKAFERRFSFLGKPGLVAINTANTLALRIFDVLRLGMMVNVYAKKLSLGRAEP